MENNKNDDAQQSEALLSHSSILIFSGFLVGLGSSLSLSTAMSRQVLLSGLVGMIAYFALGLLATKRRERDSKAAHRLATSRLEKRLDRHNPRSAPALTRTNRPFLSEEEEQYLTVVRSSRIKRLVRKESAC